MGYDMQRARGAALGHPVPGATPSRCSGAKAMRVKGKGISPTRWGACLLGLGLAMAPAAAWAQADPSPTPAPSPTAPLALAAARNDVGRLEKLLASGANIEAPDQRGYRALHWAALAGQIEAVEFLLQKGAQVEARDSEGYTPLMWAAQNRKLTVLRRLLVAGASANAPDAKGYAPLTWAAQDGVVPIAEALLAAGADPNFGDGEGYSPLMWAAQQGHVGLVKLLLARGARPELRSAVGHRAIDLARAFHRPLVVAELERAMGMASAPAPAPIIGAPPGPIAPRALRVPREGLVAIVGPQGRVAIPVVGVQPAAPRPVAPMVTPVVPLINWSAPEVASSWAERLRAFDTDGNEVLNGHDWAKLLTAKRMELGRLLHAARAHQRNLGVDAVVTRLDWVYADPKRRDLTLNMAFDYPLPGGGEVRW